MVRFPIVYPDVRMVSENTIRGWLADSIANDECDKEYNGLTIDPQTIDIQVAMDLLQDTGRVTFGKI